MLLILAYPLYVVLVWKFGAGIKSSSPIFAILVTSIPALITVGGITYIAAKRFNATKFVEDFKAEQGRAERLIQEAFESGDYPKAFAFYTEAEKRAKGNVRPVGIDLLKELRKIPIERVDSSLINEVILFTMPGLRGRPIPHFNEDLNNIINVSHEVLGQLDAWRRAGAKPQGLVYSRQWIFDNSNLFANGIADLQASLSTEHPSLSQFFVTSAERFQPTEEDAKKTGPVFGSLLHAVILHNKLTKYPKAELEDAVIAKGGKLAPGEEKVRD